MERFRCKGDVKLALRRDMIGVVLVALTASTIFMLFIVGERAENMLEILENRYPAEIRHDQRNTFSVALIARKTVKYLDIEVNSLHRVGTDEMEIEMGKFGRDAMLSLDAVSSLSEMAKTAGLEPVEYEMKVVRNKTTHDMYVLDFAGTLSYMDEDILAGYFSPGITTIYAGLFNESGLAYLYTGFKDFFPIRNNTITELSVTYNDDKKIYKRIKELSPSEIQSGVPTLPDAPRLGTLKFSDLVKDDTVRLAFSVDRSTVPYSDGIELVRVFSNGILEDEMANWYLTG